MRTNTVKITRQELFQQIWTQPMVKLAKTYKLSDVGLRKICKRYNIPLPPQGYWLRKRRPLAQPILHPHKNELIEIQVLNREFTPGIQEEYEKAMEQANMEKGKDQIRVSSQLRNPHPLVAKTLLSFKNARLDNLGRLIPNEENVLNITSALGMKPQSFSGAKSANKIPLDILCVYASGKNISLDWLLTGEHKGVPDELAGITEDSPIFEVVKAMKAMPRSKWGLARDIMKRLSEEEN